MNWTNTRFGLYAIGIIGSGSALWLAAAGFADYDATTGVIDIHPFNVTQTITQAVSWVANIVAAIALWKRWGAK